MTLLAHDTFFDFNKLLDGVYSPYKHLSAQNPTRYLAKNSNTANPRVDILKQDNGYQLIAELPGVDKEQVAVTLEESILTIETNLNQTDAESTNKKLAPEYLRRERFNGKYKRSFDLGQNIEYANISANFKDGLLILNIPLQKEEIGVSKTIDIH